MTIKHQCITPMFNIHVDNDIKMKHFTIFKTRTMQEINKLGFHIEKADYGNFAIEPWTRWPLLSCEAVCDIHSEEALNNLPKKFNRFYDMLILFKNNIHCPLVIGPVFGMAHNDPQIIWSVFHRLISPDYIKTAINLSENEMMNFDNMYNQLEPILFQDSHNKILKRVFYAIAWLGKARTSPKFYDKFIFLSIALETLISDHQNELSYRISQRAAFLIGETDDQRYKIFSKMRDIYKSRSKIVHGDYKQNTKNNELWFLQEMVRVLILKMISLSKYYENPTKLLQEINDGLIKTDLRNDIMYKSNELFSICSKFVPPSKF